MFGSIMSILSRRREAASAADFDVTMAIAGSTPDERERVGFPNFSYPGDSGALNAQVSEQVQDWWAPAAAVRGVSLPPLTPPNWSQTQETQFQYDMLFARAVSELGSRVWRHARSQRSRIRLPASTQVRCPAGSLCTRRRPVSLAKRGDAAAASATDILEGTNPCNRLDAGVRGQVRCGSERGDGRAADGRAASRHHPVPPDAVVFKK